jgi:transcriptional regulator with XRE-family HTH domain
LGANQNELYFLGMTKSVFTERYQTFISLLVSARQKQGLSQRDLAIKLNKVHSFVAKYEQGERRLDVIEFLDIAEALDVNPEGIIKKLKKSPK